MGRPPIPIDDEQVEALAGINCTMEEIATVLGCSVDTISRRFAEAVKRGREQGRSSLRRYMWEKVKEGNVVMMIWLSKQILGYRDRTEIDIMTIPNELFIAEAKRRLSLNADEPKEVQT